MMETTTNEGNQTVQPEKETRVRRQTPPSFTQGGSSEGYMTHLRLCVALLEPGESMLV